MSDNVFYFPAKLKMSSGSSRVPLIVFILSLFCRNVLRHPIFKITEHVVACNFSVSSPMHSRLSVEFVNNVQGVFFANGDEKSDDQKEDSPDPMPQKEEPEPEEPKPQEPRADEPKDEVQRHEEEAPRPRSRIETYDEFARFRDSSRPPDSHYPPGPGPGYRRFSASYIDHNIAMFITGVGITLGAS